MKNRRFLSFGAIALVIILCALAFSAFSRSEYSEASAIGTNVSDFKELSKRFEILSEERGAAYAYEILRRAELPPGTDLHLLGHVVGDQLYLQEGLDGIIVCTPEFRNACSHTIAIGALNEYGANASTLLRIDDACKKAPGGTGAYTMCYHGLGHGVFAYFGYDLAKTVSFCAEMGTEEYHNRQAEECVGGSIMELMGGGGHDNDAWLAARERYLSPSNALMPCLSSVIPDNMKPICLLYITPQLFAHETGNLANPSEREFRGAFEACDTIPAASPRLRTACFEGIGKEFPVLALARDIRTISSATDAQLRLMYTWCDIAPSEEAFTDCSLSVVDSLFWGGENDSSVSLRYCAVASEARKGTCYEYILEIASFYLRVGSPEAMRLCSGFPTNLIDSCRERLL